jgi:hypothetical protein
MGTIKDLIYFDVEKARSIISQLNRGWVSEISRAFEEERNESGEVGINVSFFKAGVGGSEKEKTVKTEKISLYHEILNEIERSLISKSILTDINSFVESSNLSYNEFLKEVPDFSFVTSTGWAVFEDYNRFRRIMENFNDVQRLIFQAGILNRDDVKVLKRQISEKKKEANRSDNRNLRTKDLNALNALERKLDNLIEESTEANFIDEDFINKTMIFLETFSPDRINFRLQPLSMFHEFQILAPLKKQYIIDSDLEQIIFTYGTRPNIKLTIMGVITSCPQIEDQREDSLDEFLLYADGEISPERNMEKAFRKVFASFENFEKFLYVPDYPKIVVSPIAIYREVKYDG